MKQVLEKAINRYLMLDPESQQRIAALQGKIVTLEILEIPLTLQMLFTANHIQLKWDNFLTADLTIRGTPLNLLHMSIARGERQRFFAEDVTVEGNMELAQQVLAIFDDLEIDWEEHLSHLTGDVLAHQTGRVWRDFKAFGKKLRRTLFSNLNEYMHEEIDLLPPAEALHDFFHEVDELRMDVDRLEARLAAIEKNIRDRV